jgi:hypothetical protein
MKTLSKAGRAEKKEHSTTFFQSEIKTRQALYINH